MSIKKDEKTKKMFPSLLQLIEDADKGNAGGQFELGNRYFKGPKGFLEDLKKSPYFSLELGKNFGKTAYGYQLTVEQDFKQAAHYHRLAADKGHAEAQFTLGNCYFEGEGVEKNVTEAARYYKLAADQGLAEAQFNLGNRYFEGEGVEKDLTEAVHYYRLAAAQGLVEAQFELGSCYYDGEGVEKDLKEAARYYKLAADQGLAEAQFNIGTIYFNGEGVKINVEKAAHYYRLAAAQGFAEAQLNLKNYCSNRESKGIEKEEEFKFPLYKKLADNENDWAQIWVGDCYRYAKHGVKRDLKKAMKYYKKSSDNGNPIAAFNMAKCYLTENDRKFKKNPTKAVSLLEKISDAAKNYHQAQYELAICHYTGNGVAHNLEKAIEYCKVASQKSDKACLLLRKLQYELALRYEKNKHSEEDQKKAVDLHKEIIEGQRAGTGASRSMGHCYEKGIGVEKDLKVAIMCYTTAANKGDRYAQVALGHCYKKGIGVKRNIEKAIELYQSVAGRGDAEAQYRLGVCYAKGEGVKQNPKRAVDYYQSAAKQDHAEALCQLGVCYERGIGVEKDLKVAERCYQSAVKQGHAGAKVNLGVFQINNPGIQTETVEPAKTKEKQKAKLARKKKDIFNQAFELFQSAADQGNPDGQYNLAVCYEKGLGVEKNMEKAICLYQLAADQKHKHALHNLGVYYEEGVGGFLQDEEKARDLYRLAGKDEGGEIRKHSASDHRPAIAPKHKAVTFFLPPSDSNSGSSSSLMPPASSSSSSSSTIPTKAALDNNRPSKP